VFNQVFVGVTKLIIGHIAQAQLMLAIVLNQVGEDLIGKAILVGPTGITKDAMQNIPASMSMKVAQCGKIKIKSRLMKMEIFKVAWEEEEADPTLIQDPTSVGLKSTILSLQYQGTNYELSGKRPSFLIGRGDQNDLIIDSTLVSRNHGIIKLRQGKFMFQDRSQNGSYLRMETKEDFKIQQEEIHLHGKGILCLGEHIEKKHPHLIYFVLKS
jgi:hypothetical protein